MKNFKSTLLLLISIFLIFTSCKRAGKEIGEKLYKESTEKVAKGLLNEPSEKTLKSLTKKELRSLDWDDLIKIIRKENLNLAEALSRLDGSFQKKIGKNYKTIRMLA